MKENPQGRYAQVNGLTMYYEVHGAGKPLVLLHGSFGLVEAWAAVLPTLTKTRQVILVELQGHGRTADIERPIMVEAMADDVAALLKHLKIEKADVFGYSMGGEVGLGLAVRHPEALGRLAILGSTMGAMKDAFERETYEQFLSITPETFNHAQIKEPYVKVAPDPSKWGELVRKIREMGRSFEGFTREQVKGITCPVLVMMGDREGVRLEDAIEMRRSIPDAQLAVFPNADHFLFFTDPNKVMGTLLPFLDAPAREGSKSRDG